MEPQDQHLREYQWTWDPEKEQEGGLEEGGVGGWELGGFEGWGIYK